MYHFLVRRKLRAAFRDISMGSYGRVLSLFASEHRHVMYGRHALAGERHTKESTAQWYSRLGRVLPGLQFDVRSIAVTGWPWRTTATVAWKQRFRLPDGTYGYNQGVHEFELRWGRVHVMKVHCDTARLEAYCRRLVADGVAEAGAEPIVDVV